ncbi:Ribonucleotide reductase of class III (anaerobic), activating protein [Anaerovibrio sp. JC8]|uniref:anaerobic ribonucleoside-triphosphate reductase activating protein n=1 Tax=Anaerovibrio sp. JC8 TaxID=1240085 RepID=UPI000A0B09E2|nr:anaerobic ribonucleoside-triphosphate reductase activating protein [Anaerovibrio sp. JC8]ORU01057.1 Ribonucleotide reductase of class III (anaerobic), activating protein [Anaerovibrio sp. JC8]
MALIKLAGTVNDSVVDGEGYRFTIFTQGCPHNCIGCHNPQTHDFDGGHEEDTDDILGTILDNPLLQGVTFSGGEPFCQPVPLTDLARKIHQHGLDVWCYTGYTIEQLLRGTQQQVELLKELDVLVDGPYQEWKRDISLSFRGSSNQRVIDVQETLKRNEVVLYEV